MKPIVSALMITLLATSAYAQDRFTGAYIGINAGDGFGKATVTDSGSGVPPGPYSYNINAPLGGLTLGYNVQVAPQFVLGVEGDVDYVAPQGKGYIASSNPAYHQDLTIGSGLLTDLNARVGLALDNTLIYAKGGVVYLDGASKQETTKPGYAATAGNGFTGFAAGLGVEQFVTDKVSIKAEYQHYWLNAQSAHQTSTIADPPTPVGTQFPNSTTLGFDTVKVGVNFHF